MLTTPATDTRTTAHDRCDRCDARAYLIVTILVPDKAKDCTLRFCAHHYGKHEARLTYSGAVVAVDDRALLKEHATV